MHTTLCPLVTNAKEWEAYQNGDEPPLQPILEVELFDIWGMDFMGHFPSSFRNLCILLAIDYVSKWVEAIPTRTNDAKVVANFLRSHILSRFGLQGH